MRCPTVGELPPPPPGRTGWPWTVAAPPLPERLPDGAPWPRLSIITPSYNQGCFLEETLRSVLLQGYPDLEYLVIDGGSTDESVAVIRKYEPWLAFWVSEKDRGQTHAINKGLCRATGRIAAFLNSDDWYLPSVFGHVARTYHERQWDIFTGRPWQTYAPSYRWLRRSWWQLAGRFFVHPLMVGVPGRYEIPSHCTFWAVERVKHLRFDEDFHFCLDAEWFSRIFPGALVAHSSQLTACARLHSESKTSRLQAVCAAEHARLADRVPARVPPTDRKRIERRFRLALAQAILYRLAGVTAPRLFLYRHP